MVVGEFVGTPLGGRIVYWLARERLRRQEVMAMVSPLLKRCSNDRKRINRTGRGRLASGTETGGYGAGKDRFESQRVLLYKRSYDGTLDLSGSHDACYGRMMPDRVADPRGNLGICSS